MNIKREYKRVSSRCVQTYTQKKSSIRFARLFRDNKNSKLKSAIKKKKIKKTGGNKRDGEKKET